MIKDIRAGKYKGIIAWHPDRLARNMKDAGEIIDLLDKKIIEDLQFPAYQFDNTPTGKMMLGMTFVMSKQYSDNLGLVVDRGNRGSIEEGKHLGWFKHGYRLNSGRQLIPDGNNHELLREAALIKIRENMPLAELAIWLNEQGYTSSRSGKAVQGRMTRSTLSIIFTDPFYAGVMQWGKHPPMNLTEAYDFVPMLTVSEYIALNRATITNGRRSMLGRTAKRHGKRVAMLLAGMVSCNECKKTMVVGITPKKNKVGLTEYYYVRCNTPDCIQRDKSVRAKVLIDHASKLLGLFSSTPNKVYQHYLEEIGRVNKIEKTKLKQEELRLSRVIAELEDEIERTTRTLPTITRPIVRRATEKNIERDTASLAVKQTELATIKEKRKQLQSNVVQTHEEFIELTKQLASILQETPLLSKKDYILRKVFLNWTVKDREVASYQLQSPFNKFIKLAKWRDGGPTWI